MRTGRCSTITATAAAETEPQEGPGSHSSVMLSLRLRCAPRARGISSLVGANRFASGLCRWRHPDPFTTSNESVVFIELSDVNFDFFIYKMGTLVFQFDSDLNEMPIVQYLKEGS